MSQHPNFRTKFRKGAVCFNSRQFFEAHEIWEELWLSAPEPEKTFLQGLIQVTAAFHHHLRGNPSGAKSLLVAGTAKLQRFPESYSELALGELRREAGKWMAALNAGEDCTLLKLPHIRFMEEACDDAGRTG